MEETIVSLSSGAIKAAISIIRISGKEAFAYVNALFSNKKEKNHQHVYYGYIKDAEEIIDEVMVSYFYGPHSFTGEDMVEISCHGSLFIVQKIISLLIAQGARVAERGEFSKRAFLNGRIDLVNAEAINDMINADTWMQAKLALNGLQGLTSRYVEVLAEELLDVISQIEVNIDYPEYDDVEQLTHQSVLPAITNFIEKLNQVIEDTKRGQIIKDGINTVIVGRPNVGKSSLLNALLKEDKAIVTDIAGTTRDLVEGKINFYGLTLNLIDTAGIHSSNDQIEQIGIAKTLEIIKKAQLVLLLLDNSSPLTAEDEQLIETTKDYLRIIILNKSDVNHCIEMENAICISAKNNDLKSLEVKIKEMFHLLTYNNEPLLFNARQEGLLKKAKAHLLEAKEQAENGQVIDLISIDIREAYACILEILGKVNKENLLDSIFSKFCLGK